MRAFHADRQHRSVHFDSSDSTCASRHTADCGRMQNRKRIPGRLTRRLQLQELEDRTMLTGAGDGRFVDFNALLIDPDDYDSSSIIVRFRSDSACGQSTCGGWQGKDFLSGTHIGRSLTRFSELRSIRISDGVGVNLQ